MIFPVVILAYGVSGSGKTHSMNQLLRSWIRDLGGYADAANVTVSAVEMGNSAGRDDCIPDLLNQSSTSLKFNSASREYYLDPTQREISRDDHSALDDLLQQVSSARRNRSTVRNQSSSRSHCVYILVGPACLAMMMRTSIDGYRG